MIEIIDAKQIRYKRKCTECGWVDDVERKWEEAPLDYKDDTIYVCPECGYMTLNIEITLDGYAWMFYSYRGVATVPPGLIKATEE